VTRCSWCGQDPFYQAYHDHEWGVPVYEDQRLFEFLTLEGAQAGLSWITILRKRENYRLAFEGFDPARVASFPDSRIEELMQNPGIIRNRQKIVSAVRNARAFLKIQDEFGSFSDYQWRFVEGKPIQNRFELASAIPAKTPLAEAFSKDLKQRGFSFLGPVVIYAHMQACGMVNDHITSCFRHSQLTHA